MLKLQLGVECTLDLKQRREKWGEKETGAWFQSQPATPWLCDHVLVIQPVWSPALSSPTKQWKAPQCIPPGREPRRRERSPPGVQGLAQEELPSGWGAGGRQEPRCTKRRPRSRRKGAQWAHPEGSGSCHVCLFCSRDA